MSNWHMEFIDEPIFLTMHPTHTRILLSYDCQYLLPSSKPSWLLLILLDLIHFWFVHPNNPCILTFMLACVNTARSYIPRQSVIFAWISHFSPSCKIKAKI